MKVILTLVAALMMMVQPNVSSAQQKKRCGTAEYLEKMKAEDPTLAERIRQDESTIRQMAQQQSNLRTNGVNTVIMIPVVFHVLYKTTGENISDARIIDQVATLNKDYARMNSDSIHNVPAPWRTLCANTNIQFGLARRDPNGNATNGIVRVPVTASGFDLLSNQNAKYTSMGGDDAWPRGSYLNVWVVNFNGSSSSLLGISQFPNQTAATDGCCVLYTTVGGNTNHGTEPGYNLGRTLTHEVGHWLGLYHTWGDDDNQDGSCSSPSECSGSDNVTDTPNQGEENYGTPSFPQIDCCSSSTTVNNTGDPINGVMFMNYMDYVNDNWMNMFTQGQSTSMHNIISQFRSTIPTSNGLDSIIGIEKINQLVLDVSIFPNPAANSVTVSCQLTKTSDLTVSLSNLLGETLYATELKNVLDVNLPIDLSCMANGVYNLSLRNNDGVINRKVVLAK